MKLPSFIVLLRIPNSFYLLPVFMFAFSFSQEIDFNKAAFLFGILHLLIYPGSFGFNSYMDKDIAHMGGLRNPPKPDHWLLLLSLVLFGLGIGLAYQMDMNLGHLVSAYVLFSITYSWNLIRLKKYGLIALVLVSAFQGFVVYSMVYLFCQKVNYLEAMLQNNYLIPAIISTVMVAGIFPIWGVYRHKSDEKRGEKTISKLLGIRGTFEFCAAFSLVFGAWLGFFLTGTKQSHLFYLFLCFIFPVIAFSLWWVYKVWEDASQANFRYTMIFNKIFSAAMILYFILVFIMRGADGLPVY